MLTISDPNRRLSRNPRNWPEALKQAIADCCCDGSGSGSGGAPNCCGCPNNGYPLSLTASFDSSCFLGERTLAAPRIVAQPTCVDTGEPQATGLHFFYSGLEENTPVEEAQWISCVNGFPVISVGGYEESASVSVGCYRCSDGTYRWIAGFSWYKYLGGTDFYYVMGGAILELVSCDPLVFADVELEVVCIDDRTESEGGTCGDEDTVYNEAWSVSPECVGSTFVLSISE